MNKGFTLIELLAVIVVLAVLVLVSVPIIQKVIKKAEDKATINSSYNYIDSVKISLALEEIDI